MPPLVSLVITTHNRAQFLETAIASIVHQTYPHFELLVWDDGSTDGSVELAQEYAAQDARVRVVAAAHQGRVAALRQAIAHTHGELLGWVDDDDWLAPTALAETVAYLEAQPTVGLVYTDYYDTDASGQNRRYGDRCHRPYSATQLLVEFMVFHFRLLRRSHYLQVGGLDSAIDFMEDYDLCLRLAEITSFGHIPKPLYYYRHHADNVSQKNRLRRSLATHRLLLQTLQRRGLAPTHTIELELPTQRFSLRRRRSPLTFALAALTALPLLGSWGGKTAIAQPVPAADGTGTVVTPNGNQFNIGGGTLSTDGQNLFHSFSQFGLTQGQIANFLANPQLQNILGRISGNSPSFIDGRLQISGGSPNLFLLNPAGIVFGANASLNVSAAFTATTATAIGFGCGAGGSCTGWFNATGPIAASPLTGTPNGFAFATSQPGAIVNAGNLAVTAGRSLTLLGGTVVNTGQLTAPDGQVILAGVPGETFVRLSQPGNVLSLEFQPLSPNAAIARPNSPAPTLSELLTGGNVTSATGLTVNPDGTVTLTSAKATIPTRPGTAIASGQINTAGTTGGTIAVLGDRVGVVDATITATGTTGGGSVFLGGDYQGQGTLPTANRTYVSSRSAIEASATQTGNGGKVIVWANQNTDFLGTIAARGGPVSGNGGFVEVSGKETLQFRGTVNTKATNGLDGTLLLDPTNITIVTGSGGADDIEISDGQILATDGGTASFTISEEALESLAGGTNITLQATNDIIIQGLVGNSLTFAAGTGTIAFQAGGAITMQVLSDAIVTQGRSIAFAANTINLGTIDTSAPTGFATTAGGNIALAATGNITTGDLIANGFGYFGTTTAGAIAATSQTGAIAVGTVQATGNPATQGGSVNGNTVLLQTNAPNGGDIRFTSIDTRGFSNVAVTGPLPLINGGNVAVLARGTVRGAGQIAASGVTIATGGVFGGSDGQVAIQHDGGPTNQPFTVANGPILPLSGNGLAGTINRRSEVIAGQTFDFPGSPFTSASGGTQITFINNTPTLAPIPPLPAIAPNTTVNTTLAALGLVTGDFNADNPLSIRVAAIAPGAVLKVNGVVAIPGTLIPPDAVLEYSPPPGFVGLLAAAFALTVDDRISTSPPQPVALNILPPRPTNPGEPGEPPTSFPNPCVLTSCQPVAPVFPNTVTVAEFQFENETPETRFTNDFVAYLGTEPVAPKTLDEQKDIAQTIERETGAKPAFVYISFVPASLRAGSNLTAQVNGAGAISNLEQDSDQLEIVVVTGKGDAIRRRIPEATRSAVMAVANAFQSEVSDPRKTRTVAYLAPAQQLHQWMIAPIQATLTERKIDNLVFLMTAGLRSLPMAALHDGNQFLVERYSVGLMPSLSLTDTRYQDIRDAQLLTLGISQSTQGQPPLPSVLTEVATIVNELWSGQSYLNSAVTLDTLKAARQARPYGIIHMATHADFLPGSLENSYIQLWEDKLRLDQIRELGWSKPQVQLLVLSACATALGDREAELGFGGLAVQSGVKSAVASLWSVDDVATAALITRFYKELKTAPIKAEALRQAQIALLKGQVYVQNSQIIGVEANGLPLPPDVTGAADKELVHPFFWSAFTMIGNPW